MNFTRIWPLYLLLAGLVFLVALQAVNTYKP